MILPINVIPSLTSYVQHSYPNAIIQSRELLILYVSKMDTFKWKTFSNDFEYKIKGEYLYLSEKNEHRNNTDFFIQRECKSKEEIIFKTEYIKRTDSMAYIESYLTLENREEFVEKANKIYSIQWNQFNVNINDILYEYDMHQFIYFKIKRIGLEIYAYISLNGTQWEVVGKSFNLGIDIYTKCYIGIHAYVGKNQFLAWKNMNYLQLFYNETDTNGVWLDYYMFPRKGVDAGYHCYCQFLDTIYNKLDESVDIFKDIHNYIKWNINHKYYVNICLDEYFVSGRKAFNIKHYYHYNLFYGYDDENSVYHLIGYKDGKIVKTKIQYDILQLEIIIGNDIVKYRYNISNEMIFDVDYLTNSVKEYLFGINSSTKTANLLTQKKGSYGLNIFNELLSTPKGRDIIINDFRTSFLLYEHCKIMQDRLKYLLAYNYIAIDNQNELSYLYEDMLKWAEILKNTVLKQLLTGGLEDKIIIQLKVLYGCEKIFYNTLLKFLLDKSW